MYLFVYVFIYFMVWVSKYVMYVCDVYPCVYVCASLNIWMKTMWGHLTVLLCHYTPYIIETQSLTDSDAGQQPTVASCLHSPLPCCYRHVQSCLAFHLRTEDLNSGHHDCTTDNFTHSASLQPLTFYSCSAMSYPFAKESWLSLISLNTQVYFKASITIFKTNSSFILLLFRGLG